GALVLGLAGYYWGNLIATIAIVGGGIMYLERKEHVRTAGRSSSLGAAFRRYPEIVSFSTTLYVISFTSPLADLVARYAVLHQGGLVAAGLFQAAIGLAFAMRTVVRSAFAVLLMPSVNRHAPISEKVERSVEFTKAISITAGVLALPLVLCPDL